MDYHFFLTSKHYAALIMNKDIIGRKKEQESLIRFIQSDESEFIAIYGRRRVGKTF